MSSKLRHPSQIDWRRIEQKPEDWEIRHALIKNAIDKEQTRENGNEGWSNPSILELFLSMYPQLEYLFQVKEMEKNITVRTKSKKKGVGNRQKIHEQVEKQKIRRDLEQIRFDERKCMPLRFQFEYEATFGFMILLWCWKIVQQGRTDKCLCLNGLITLERYITQYLEHVIFPIKCAFETMVKEMKQCFSEAELYETLFSHPVYMVTSLLSKKRKEIRLYPEQLDIIQKVEDAIILDKPLLIGNQMPTGMGKTFLTAPLTQRIAALQKSKTILFSCSNELVNVEVASNALLGDDLQLWMAKSNIDENGQRQVFLRPHKRCFPSTWKTVYKKEDSWKTGEIWEQWQYYLNATGKQPHLIVADLTTALLLLQNNARLDSPFIAMIDEFISDEKSNQIVAKICRVLPSCSILISAILPTFQELAPIVECFCEKYNVSMEECVYRVGTNQTTISCAIIGPTGQLKMPHHFLKKVEDIDLLLEQMVEDPRIRRTYCAKYIYGLAFFLKSRHVEIPSFGDFFPKVSTITHTNVLDYMMIILQHVRERPEWFPILLEYSPCLYPHAVDADALFTTDAYLYEGKTLYVTDVDKLYGQLEHMTEKMYHDMPRWDVLESVYKTKRQEIERQLQRLDQAKMNQQEKIRLQGELRESSPVGIHLPHKYVINSLAHFRYFHPETTIPPGFKIKFPISLDYETREGLNDFMRSLLASGIGVYEEKWMTFYQRKLVMQHYSQLSFLVSSHEVVFGTNLPDLTNIMVRGDFGDHVSKNVLYQLMGRIGRMGQSYHATLVTDSEKTLTKLLDFYKVENENQELKCLLFHFQFD